MKVLAILLIFTSCAWDTTHWVEVKNAEERCKKNDGMRKITMRMFNIRVYCRDGAVFGMPYPKPGGYINYPNESVTQ